METIDQAPFNFSPTAGAAVAVMLGFLVFAVALDLTWDQFRRVLRSPRAPLIGLLAQFLVLPGVAFGVGLMTVDSPSIALRSGCACRSPRPRWRRADPTHHDWCGRPKTSRGSCARPR